jgi:hypothetical protein
MNKIANSNSYFSDQLVECSIAIGKAHNFHSNINHYYENKQKINVDNHYLTEIVVSTDI